MEETLQLVNSIIDGIQEKKGRSIVTVDLSNILTAPCTYFVICTGTAPQHTDAICDSVEEFTGKQLHEKPARIAGRDNAEWIAMDYGTVMVHILLPEAREHYDIENLWYDAQITQVADID